jgi:hypothetical protein
MIESYTVRPMTVALIVVVLSSLGAILSEKVTISYTTIMISIGLALSFLRIGGELSNILLEESYSA